MIGIPRWSTIRRQIGGRWRDFRRRLWLRRHVAREVPRTALFVVGCQRSGTNMVMWTLERSPFVWVYHEHVWSAAFRNFRLRPTERINQLIRDCAAPTVAFKPVCDSHLTDRLLDRHGRTRAIWIYRGYRDVAKSAVRLFGNHQRDVMGWIAHGDFDWLGWRGERLPADAVDLARTTHRADMPPEAAAAFLWYLRNRFFFDLGLDRDERVLLVRYEDLVGGQVEPFRRVFDFVGLQFEPSFLDGLYSTSIGRGDFPRIDPAIETCCRELTGRLDEAYRDAVGSHDAAEPSSPAAGTVLARGGREAGGTPPDR